MTPKKLTHSLMFAVLALQTHATAIAAPAAGAELLLTDAIDCAGDEEVVLRGRNIQTDGDAVVVSGECNLALIDSRIIAAGTAIAVGDNGSVTLTNSYVEGVVGAIIVNGNGAVSFGGCAINGIISATGDGGLINLGGNDLTLTEGSPLNLAATNGTTEPDHGPDADNAEEGSAKDTAGQPDDRSADGDGQVSEASIEIDGTTVDLVVNDGWSSVGTDGHATDGNWRSGGSAYTEADVEWILAEFNAQQSPQGLRLELAGDVMFDFNKAGIRADAVHHLAKLAHLVRHQGQGGIFIVGHTDSIGGESYNQILSKRRAVSVMAWLNQHEGIPGYIMKAQGMGEQRPIADNVTPDGADNPEGRARNRRVEIRLAPY